jgi:hypothetical protein
MAKTTQPLIAYSAEIEARRADYQALAESIIQMSQLQSARASTGLLDVEPPGWVAPEPAANILHDAIEEHFRALFENLLVCYKHDFLRTLYVELRLYYDEQMLHLDAGEFQYRRQASARKGAR